MLVAIHDGNKDQRMATIGERASIFVGRIMARWESWPRLCPFVIFGPESRVSWGVFFGDARPIELAE